MSIALVEHRGRALPTLTLALTPNPNGSTPYEQVAEHFAQPEAPFVGLLPLFNPKTKPQKPSPNPNPSPNPSPNPNPNPNPNSNPNPSPSPSPNQACYRSLTSTRSSCPRPSAAYHTARSRARP